MLQPDWPPIVTTHIREAYAKEYARYTQAVRVAYDCGVYECQIDPPLVRHLNTRQVITLPKLLDAPTDSLLRKGSDAR